MIFLRWIRVYDTVTQRHVQLVLQREKVWSAALKGGAYLGHGSLLTVSDQLGEEHRSLGNQLRSKARYDGMKHHCIAGVTLSDFQDLFKDRLWVCHMGACICSKEGMSYLR